MIDVVLGHLQTVVGLIVILAVLVFFHELGHFGVAKMFGMRVEEFALGFGPKLWRIAYDGQTEYNLRAVPLGGFVRIAGMEVEDAVERRLTGGGEDKGDDVETTNTRLMEQEAEEVSGSDPDGFNNRPLHQRFLVILAGPVFSVLLGWLVLCLVPMVVGFPSGESTTQIAIVRPGEPAAAAGLEKGDTIVAIDGEEMKSGEQMIQRIHGSAGKSLRFTIRGEGMETTRDVTITPKKGAVEGKVVGLIGITPEVVETDVMERLPFGQSISWGTARTLGAFQQIANIFISGKLRENLGGPIAIAQATGSAVEAGGPSPLLLLAQLSLSIGIFNLFPIPVLDGGHLVLLTLEGIRGRKLTADQTNRVLTTGLAIIAFLFVWVMFNDIQKLFNPG